MQSVGVALLTYNAEKLLPLSLPPLLAVKRPLKILVVNSSSPDRTLEVAKEFGVETLIVPRAEFNHGLSRNIAREKLGTDIVVMMTPDAILQSPEALDALISPIEKGEAALSYLRQVPHKGAEFFESFPRAFNYPENSHLRSMKDLREWGSYLPFCSNSCAAYSNRALDSIGGFQKVLIGEDTLAAAAFLQKGETIAYVAEEAVYHSHSYTLNQEFKRSFDTGLARNEDLLKAFGRDEKRGVQYIRAMLSQLKKEQPLQIPYALLHLFVRYVGYRLGKFGEWLPTSLKRKLSSQDFYWV